MTTLYVLTNERGDIYIGQTNDFARRLAEHNRKQSKSTKYGATWITAHQETFRRQLSTRTARTSR